MDALHQPGGTLATTSWQNHLEIAVINQSEEGCRFFATS